MTLTNGWVGYLTRNYRDIKIRVLTKLGNDVPEVTDHSDSNILIVVIGIFAGIAEMLNYYIDNMAREAFITTARKYSSVVKHTRLIDYRIKAKIPASVDLTVYLLNNDNSPYIVTEVFTVPIGSKFTTANGVEFLSTSDIEVKLDSTFIQIPLKQKTKIVNELLGQTTSDPDQVYPLGKDYVYNSLELTIGGEPWNLKETLGRSLPSDKDYIVEVSGSKEAYIRFGDNINGAIPTMGLELRGNYYTSLGALGNVEPNTIINSDINFSTTFNIPKVNITNINKAVAGTDFEDIKRIQRSAPLSLRTLNRAVTKQDYVDIALLAPGVDKAKIDYNCGKYVPIYISPNGGGIASTGLLQDVKLYFEDKKMVTTFINPIAVGESLITINIHVVGKFRIDGNQLREDVIALLLDTYSYDNSDINKAIRLSDLMALIDNLSKVDYLKVTYLSLIPYIRPIRNNTTNLNTRLVVNQGSKNRLTWIIKWDGNWMKILKNNFEVANLAIGDVYSDNDNIIQLRIDPGDYEIGMEWSFETVAVNSDILVDDFSIPVLKLENLRVTVEEQLSI